MHIMRIPEREQREKGTEEKCETITKNFPKSRSDSKPHIQEAQKIQMQDKCP